MAYIRPRHPQERALLLAAKAGLRSIHEGPYAIPRKVIWMGLGVDESTYSRWCNPEEPDFPDFPTLGRIVNLAQNPAPIREALRLVGEGYEVRVADGCLEPQASPIKLLGDTARVDGAVLDELAQDLEDSHLTIEEARRLLPKARAQLINAQRVVDLVESVINSRRAS